MQVMAMPGVLRVVAPIEEAGNPLLRQLATALWEEDLARPHAVAAGEDGRATLSAVERS